MESPQIKPVARTIHNYLTSVSNAVNQLKDHSGNPVQIPDYEVLQRAASRLDISPHPSDTALVIQKLLGRGLSYDMVAPGPDYKLTFPRDHHIHPTMGAEWYYLAGNLQVKDPKGHSQRLGIMIWIQKNRMVGQTAQTQARWTDQDCTIVASKATAILAGKDGKGRIVRRTQNNQWPAKGGKIGYSKPGEDFRFECGPDSFSGSQNVLPMRAIVDDGDNLNMDLTVTCQDGLTAEKAFFLRGTDSTGLTGLPTPGIVYGWPNVKIAGSVVVDGTRYTVESGTGWIDHQLLMASLENPGGATLPIPFVDDPKPFIGWCWMFVNLGNNATFTCIAINTPGLSLNLQVIPDSIYYVSLKNGQWENTPLDSPTNLLLENFLALPTITSDPGPNQPNVLIPDTWGLVNPKSKSSKQALAGQLTSWSGDSTFNFEDWTLVSEAPVDFTDPTGNFANGTGFVEVIGFENVLSFQMRSVAFLETGILPGPPVDRPKPVSAKKPLLVKLGAKTSSEVTALKQSRNPRMKSQISDILAELERNGKVDRDAQVVVAVVREEDS